jgi:hypothetical protein
VGLDVQTSRTPPSRTRSSLWWVDGRRRQHIM